MLASTALACVLVLTGCGSDETAAGAPESDPAESLSPTTDEPETGTSDGGGGGGGGGGGHAGPADDEPAVEVPEVLDFEATQVSGAAFEGADLAGTDTVFWFWAPWCTECAAAAAGVQAAAEASGDVSFVGVAGLSSDDAAMQGFVDQHGLDFPQLSDTSGDLYARFGVTVQDTYVLVSADGAVETVEGYGGDVDPQQLVDETFG